MKILAIDTSNKVASVSVFEDEKLLNEEFSDDQKTHSEKLLPMVDDVLKKERMTIRDIDLFVVSVGPGSFTGIRIGVATIKGMAQALNKKVIPVTSLEGLLEMADSDYSCAIINARHGNVYAQIKAGGEMLTPDCKSINEVIDELKKYNGKWTIAGDATIEFKDLLSSKLDCVILDKTIETSSDIGRFALNKYFADKNIAKIPHEILPIYLRKAQPDREV